MQPHEHKLAAAIACARNKVVPAGGRNVLWKGNLKGHLEDMRTIYASRVGDNAVPWEQLKVPSSIFYDLEVENVYFDRGVQGKKAEYKWTADDITNIIHTFAIWVRLREGTPACGFKITCDGALETE